MNRLGTILTRVLSEFGSPVRPMIDKDVRLGSSARDSAVLNGRGESLEGRYTTSLTLPGDWIVTVVASTMAVLKSEAAIRLKRF